MIAIIDYGMGNLRSVQKGFERMGLEAVVTREPHTILDASKVVLPGVGAFPDCMRNLEQYGLINAVRSSITSGKPFLGICLGLQLMGTTFGGKVAPGTIGGYAEVDVEILKENDILKGLPPKFKTWASHMDQVVELPDRFEVLARSSVGR